MKTVSMLELRRDARAIIQRVCRGQRLVLTYRGRQMVRLEPVEVETPDDGFYELPQLADTEGGSLTNREIDEAVYGT